ncbi:MAG TPA: aminomethyl-transferring glycine dehydrogenase subunit GcvPA [Candidatus Acidoferrales bacterium]|nr:aminomethyl-transferring glycine dehydrogenase subunit GcvPA [Candidatus Acidoferrales bacterium]
MRYTPHTEADRRQMLDAIGLSAIEEVFAHVPEELRARARIRLAEGLSEVQVKKRLSALAARNATPGEWSFFLGAGIYHHFIPSTVDAIISRGEFATSYTPYQPEVSQGTLQAIYEFQTLWCQLTGMEVANAGLYDGASAAAEAVLMARRVQQGRRRIVLSRALHPQYRSVISTYLKNLPGVELIEAGFDETGASDAEALARAVDDRTICVVVGYPNFFGVIEDLAPVQELCSRHGSLLIAVTTEALSLGLLKPPGEWGADIAAGEGQSLGVPMSLGGPGYGFFACRKKFLRSMPGRVVGETVDSEGRRGFVLTLSTREQHIRREKATSNICTNQNLCGLASTVFMATLGKSGLRRLAEINAAVAHETCARLVREAGLTRLFAGPFFNEFVLRVDDLEQRLSRLRADKIIAGLPLARWYPELRDSLLVCVTEMNEREEIEQLVKSLTRR